MQLWLRDLVCWLHENRLADICYLSLQFLALAVSHVLAVLFAKRLGLAPKRALIAVIIEVAIVYIEMAILCMILEEIIPAHIPVMNSYYNNVGRTFVLVPLSALLVSWVMKLELKRVLALYSIAQPTIWGLASLPCLLAGCCRGYPCKWGIYNVETRTYVFPTQLVNCLCLCFVACLIVWRTKKRENHPDGLEYPITLILIGLTRFFTEFIMDSPKIVYGLSSLSFDSVGMIMVGIVSLIVISCVRMYRKRAVSSVE